MSSQNKRTQSGDINSRIRNKPKERTLLFHNPFLYFCLLESGRLCIDMGWVSILGSQILYPRYNLGCLGSFLEAGIQVSSLQPVTGVPRWPSEEASQEDRLGGSWETEGLGC